VIISSDIKEIENYSYEYTGSSIDEMLIVYMTTTISAESLQNYWINVLISSIQMFRKENGYNSCNKIVVNYICDVEIVDILQTYKRKIEERLGCEFIFNDSNLDDNTSNICDLWDKYSVIYEIRLI
jgi:hypothetical protein